MNKPSLENPFLAELFGHCKSFFFRSFKQYKKKRRVKKEPKITTYNSLPDSLQSLIQKKSISTPSEFLLNTEKPKTDQSVEWIRQFSEDRLAVGSKAVETSATDEFAELDKELHLLHPSYKEQSKVGKKVMKKAMKITAIPLAPQQKKHAIRLYQNHANRFSSPKGWAHIALLSVLHVYLSSKQQVLHDWHELIEEIAKLETDAKAFAYDSKSIISAIKSGDFHPQLIDLFNHHGFTFNPSTQSFEAQSIR